MPVPDFETLMLPILRVLSDGNVHTLGSLRDGVATRLNLSESDTKELLPSGRQTRLMNRVSWANMDLVRAGLVEKLARGQFKLSVAGRDVIAKSPARIDVEFLMSFPLFVEWRRSYQKKEKLATEDSSKGDGDLTPEERLLLGYQDIQNTLADAVIDKVKSCSPQFFEHLVVELLTKMGYGGSLPEAGQVIGKSGDGGIDGLIKEDKLGLDVIYVQAKRWEGSVSAGSVRDFSGSLDYHGAKKGVFITTSSFTSDAKNFVTKLGEKRSC